jgi:exodeoxyribonuclease VII large subunit
LHDVLTALARRAPQVRVIVYPSAVQGADAPAQLVQAITLAGARAEVDTLIVCRGGGAIEDLWAFNDEAVVRAIVASPMPVVCGVGHETDVTLADLAADLRAPTPTAAAELASPLQSELMLGLSVLERRMHRTQRQRLDTMAQDLDLLAARLVHGVRSMQPQRQQLALLAQRAQASLTQRLQLARQTLAHGAQRWQRARQVSAEQRRAVLGSLADRLALLDPQCVLSRGYALIETAAGELVLSPSQMKEGEALKVSLAHGQADLVPQRVRPRNT